MCLSPSPAFVLEKAVGDRRQHDVAFPSRQAATFEVIEPNLVLEFLILLLDSPSLMGEADEGAQRGAGWEIHQVISDAVAVRRFPFAQQPDFGSEPSAPANSYEAVERDQQRRLVALALARLPEKERAAVVLRDIEGLPAAEVARILGSSEATVRSQTSKARVKIRQILKRYL